MEQTLQEEQKLYISPAITSKLPSMVRNELAKMSRARQFEFYEEYKRQQKSTSTGYLLWIFLGLHYGYTRKWGLQFAYWFTAGGLFVWMFIDLFRMPSIIRNYNKDRAIEVMKNLKAFS